MEFPFCEDSVGLTLEYYENNFVHENTRNILFCETEDIDVINFCGVVYFRLNQPYIKISEEAKGFRVNSKNEIVKTIRIINIVYASEVINKCIWLEVNKCIFNEEIEYPEWVSKSREDAQKEVEEIEQKAYENTEKRLQEEIEEMATTNGNKEEKSLIKIIAKLFKNRQII